MKRIESGEHLKANPHGFDKGYGTATESCGEGLTLEQLHGDEELPISLADLVHLTDMGMIDAGREAGLPPEALADGNVVGRVALDDLQRDRSLELFVYGRVDHTHASLAQRLRNAIATEAFLHRVVIVLPYLSVTLERAEIDCPFGADEISAGHAREQRRQPGVRAKAMAKSSARQRISVVAASVGSACAP